MNNFRKHYAFYIHFCSWRGKGRCSLPVGKKYVGGFTPMWSFFLMCGKCLGLSPLEQISGGAHAFDARVVPNNNVALTEFERNCKT